MKIAKHAPEVHFLLKRSTQPSYIAAVIPPNEEQDQLFLPVYLLPDPALIQAQGTHNAAAFLNLANSYYSTWWKHLIPTTNQDL